MFMNLVVKQVMLEERSLKEVSSTVLEVSSTVMVKSHLMGSFKTCTASVHIMLLLTLLFYPVI